MKVHFKRFDLTIPAPKYQTAGSVGLDLACRQTMSIEPGEVVIMPLNIALQLPKGTWALMAARSSLHKKGVMLANGIGVGDSDYCGEDDEYKAVLFNFSKNAVRLEKGERIVQMIIMQYDPVELIELEHFSGVSNRGGFGSTGR